MKSGPERPSHGGPMLPQEAYINLIEGKHMEWEDAIEKLPSWEARAYELQARVIQLEARCSPQACAPDLADPAVVDLLGRLGDIAWDMAECGWSRAEGAGAWVELFRLVRELSEIGRQNEGTG